MDDHLIEMGRKLKGDAVRPLLEKLGLHVTQCRLG